MSGYHLLPAAFDDLYDLVEYASSYDDAARDRLTDALVECFERLYEFPSLGRPREDLGPSVRSFPVNRLRVTVYYLADGDPGAEVLVARILRHEWRVTPEDIAAG